MMPRGSRARAGIAALAALLAGGCSRGIPAQGEVSGEVVADGLSYPVSGALLAATVSVTGGWAAWEVDPLSPTDGTVAPDIGPLCLWLRLDLLSAAGPLSLADPWPDVAPPFTDDAWYCLPGGEAADLFLGVRCQAPQIEETPTPGEASTATPGSPSPGAATPTALAATPTASAPATPTPGAATPAPAAGVSSLLARSGGVEIVEPASGPCQEVTIKLTGVAFTGQACEGPVTSLTLTELTVSGTLLSPGRDWETGGYTECRGAF